MSEPPSPDQSERSPDKLIALVGNEVRDVDTGYPIDHWCWLGQHDVYPEPVLEWRGPIAFSRVYGTIPGIDHDFGVRWGSNRDQRVSLRVELGREEGLLYVYDPTWDEYAVMGNDVPLAAVKDAFARALQLGEHVAVEDFVTLLPNVHSDRLSPVPEP